MAGLAIAETREQRWPWFALWVRSNFEHKTSNCLNHKGFEQFTPFYQSKRRWSDRVKNVKLPLFPGYVFCRFDPRRQLPILTTPGVVAIVSFGGAPTPLDDQEIEAIRIVVGSGREAQPHPFVRVGYKVRLVGGPLHGLEGLLLDMKNGRRVLVSVSLLQRSVAVEIDRENLEPVF